MAKTLNQFLEGYLKVKNPDEQKFVDKHVVAKHADRNGNDDEVFKGSKVKMDDRRKTRHGYNPGEDEKVYEELKGNQHKLDHNKNGKLDAHDFKLLRKKKKVAEEVEQIDELSTPTLQSYRKKARAQGNAIVDKMKIGGGDWSKDQKDTKTLRKRAAGAQASGKQLVKRGESLKTEETEQLDELSKNTLRSYVDKRATQRDLTSHDIVRRNIAAASGVKPRNKPESAASIRSYHRAINKIVKDKDSPDRPKVLATEEAEQIDELSKGTLGRYAQKAKNQMGRDEYRAGVRMGQRDGRGQDAMEKAHNKRADKRHRGLTMAIDKLAKEEVELGEKLNMDKASMGDVIKDFQDSNAPQFKGKSDKKRRAMAIAAKLTAERGGKPLRKEEKLADLLGDLTESHRRTMLSVFDKLNESNQKKFLEACETPEGVESMLDFSISHRGE